MKKIMILAIAVASLGSCTKKLDELLVNPNSPAPELASARLYLTQVQLSFADVFSTASNSGGQYSRMYNMGQFTYLNASRPEGFNGIWSSAYTGVFKHVNALLPIATAEKNWVDVGIAKTLKAYTMMTMVDKFGDIPYTEANLGTENTNPGVEKGSDVYAKAIALLDEAIVAFKTTPVNAYPGSNDLFFGASNATGAGRWVTAAKLLKLRAYNTTRLVDNSAASKINALLADPEVTRSFTDASYDLDFKFSTKQANPNSRHPRYNANYQATGNAGDYMSTYMMWTLVQEKGSGSNNDPRTRYYFYRQTTTYASVDVNTASCAFSAPPSHYPAGPSAPYNLSPMPYCLLVSGYWGRDHGDGTGIPPDGNLRTTVGIYPAGGEFDANQGTRVSLNRGGQGAGVHPIWQRAFTDFLNAEAALTIGATGSPRTLLESGIRKSIAKVVGFPSAIGAPAPDPSLVPDAARIDAYVAKVLAAYDAATTNDQRLDIIMKEWYIAAWGNGHEVYNSHRRTGKPANVQLTKDPNPGSYSRSALYPASYVNLNQNAVQKASVASQVFWDTNPAGFIK
jgi:hypothetical protein